MKLLSFPLLILALAIPRLALAAIVTGEVTYIGPDGDVVILNRNEAYVVSPEVSLAAVSVRQTITAQVSDDNGTRTIVKLLAPAAPAVKQPAQAIPAGR
ncbi:MAG TPA: hypothetical protein VG501_05595 [Rhizomicrobium sp.]|nr:hypothetical protein [Rhizomicrobium sp.]